MNSGLAVPHLRGVGSACAARPDTTPEGAAVSEQPERYYLLGDEDCGVGIYCRDCDHRGRPLTYYAGVVDDYWRDEAVPTVHSVVLLLAAMGEHEASGVHAATEQTMPIPRFVTDKATVARALDGLKRLGRAPHPRGRHEA